MEIVAGIDIGSLSAEAVIMGAKEILGYSIVPTGADSRKAAETALEKALASAGRSRDAIRFVVATGYGRANVPFADLQVTEITCHGRGAVYLFPGARTVIDIGGQDSKVIRLDERGTVVDFVMNDKCAAGTGRFLEVMARALETEVERLSEVAATAGRPAAISSMCTVFAESEVVSLIGQGSPRDEIARGLLESVAERTASMVHRVGLVPEVVMTGGVAKNSGVVRALAKRLGTVIHVPDEPQIVGALGAALVAAARAGGS
ncbi:acyl-CoA dehydratase activase [Desulforudis sp. 1088]|uniref:acyl-CoA dehydratase activase n=1 Tax=unclassified Candidatus Desulforudis TaxID=2635950 RepID=UPI003CE505BC